MFNDLRSLVLVGMLVMSLPAWGESASDAVKSFGLAGTWSAHCEMDPAKGCERTGPGTLSCPSRLVFEVPFSGSPKRTLITATRNGPPQKVVTGLNSALLITEDKIRLTWIFEGQFPAAPAAFPQNGELWEQVFAKEGAKMKTLELERADGKKLITKDGFVFRPVSGWNEFPSDWESTGQRPPPLERCLD